MLVDEARRSLEQYRPVDARELSFRSRMLELLEQPDPFGRANYVPGHLTASAFVLSPAADELLLIFHRKLRIWIQPGGHIEPGDGSLAGAARREVHEELGLSLPADDAVVFDVDIHSIPPHKAEPAHEHFDVRFCFRAENRAFAASSEVADAAWVKLTEIDQLTGDESVLRAARKLRSA